MAADRRPSVSSIRSAISRTSMSSNRNLPPQFGEYRPPSPLSAGKSLPMPSPPVPPAKDRLPPPMTPKRKPVQRQKSPLSAEAFSSPASTMPGAFPDTPSPAQEPQNMSSPSTPESSPASKASKRLSSMRNLLPFKVMRRSSEPNSPDSSSFRPTTPGQESIASSGRSSLRKKRSGSFWKRKSSLSNTFTPGQEGSEGSGHATRNGVDDDTIMEDSRPATPVLVEDTPTPLKKRQSSSHWRRKSSFTSADSVNGEKHGWGGQSSTEGRVAVNGNGTARKEPMQMERKLSDQVEKMSEPESPQSPPPMRSRSPPPQIPEFIGAGGGLGLGEDFLKGFT